MTLNAEQALIGALMINPIAVKDCGDLRADMFTDGLNGRLYLEFVRAYEFGYTANPVTFANNLPDVPKEELMNRLGGYMDASITSAAAGTVCAGNYRRIQGAGGITGHQCRDLPARRDRAADRAGGERSGSSQGK